MNIDYRLKGGRSHPLFELTLARMREYWRTPEVLFSFFVLPIILSLALGFAFRNTRHEKFKVAVEVGPNAEWVADALSSQIDPMILSADEATKRLRLGKIMLFVRAAVPSAAGQIPRAFEFRYDPTRPESRAARATVDHELQRAAGRIDVVSVVDRVVIEPGARYVDFLIPGLIGFNLMSNGMWKLGYALVLARVRKMLKRMTLTPMKREHFLLSYILARVIYMLPEVAAILVFAYLLFGVKVYGSLLSLFLVALIGAMTFCGIGILSAARAQTLEGASDLIGLITLPMWLMSGSFFSWSYFPAFLQPFIKALPLAALNDALRGVMTEGAPISSLTSPICILLLWGGASFVIALKIFRWH